MKKLVLPILLLCIIATGAFAQEPPPFDLNTMEETFSGFAGGVARALPLASTVGLQWSDAYIGNLPHLGVGVAVGFSSIPIETVTGALSTLMGDVSDFNLNDLLPAELQSLPIGFPLPAAVADIRLGGLFLPFDIGFKIGFIPDQLDQVIKDNLQGIGIDYLLWGFDVRYALVKEPKGFTLIPDIMIGGGYNYYRAGISMPMPGMDTGFSFDVPVPNASDLTSYYNYNVSMAAPKIGFNWESHVIDVKAQISKKIFLLFTPYIGVGASYGRSRAGGGVLADMTVTKDGAASSMQALKDDIADAEDAYNNLSSQSDTLKESFGDTNTSTDSIDLTKIDLPTDGGGFLINEWFNGFGLRAFGGLSINIWVLKIDASVMYDILGQSLGAQVGVRLQF